MYTIIVIHPFKLRLNSETPVRDFAEGEHTLSEEEYGHWFVQSCIQEGRAALPAEEGDAQTQDDGAKDEEQNPQSTAQSKKKVKK
ncbi:MAG: hypothetical protein FWG04_02640 [Desulfovibrionaceae bacterium]|nr:hypothetical protein [Desulfovibrionaceae bacterium]